VEQPVQQATPEHGPEPSPRHERYVRKAQDAYRDSSAEHLWKRLDDMGFINRGMLVAAILLLCFFPFMIMANALAGRSTAMISDYQKYGAIGVVFALMSWLIAIAVVIILGAVVGIIWNERGLSFAAAFRRMRRRSAPAETR
jgi:uncharacterized BrkB/YihY/UPF0761 family membrane protein